MAGLILSADGTYSFDPSNAAYQHLAAGKSVDVVANYTVKDDKGATDGGTFTITVTGINDAPTITSNDGGDEASILIAENTSPVTTVTTTIPMTGRRWRTRLRAVRTRLCSRSTRTSAR